MEMTECDECGGTGYICPECLQGTGDCQCDTGNEEECPNCDGQGTIDNDDSWGV